MKSKLLTVASVLGFMVFILPLLIVLSPLILLVLLFNLYGDLWKKIRHDPKADLGISELDQTIPAVDGTFEEYGGLFKQQLSTIAKRSGGKLSKFHYTNLDLLETAPIDDEHDAIEIQATISSPHAEILFNGYVYVYQAEASAERRLMLYGHDDDEHFDPEIFPTFAKVLKPALRVERHFHMYSHRDLWSIIALLRGDAKFTLDSGQLWAYVKEQDVWIVQYKLNRSNYGLRKAFNNATAHELKYDKPMIQVSSDSD